MNNDNHQTSYSMSMIHESSEYPRFGPRGTRVVVKVSKWPLARMDKYKLFNLWVSITGTPFSMLHIDEFPKVASMLSTIQEVNMLG